MVYSEKPSRLLFQEEWLTSSSLPKTPWTIRSISSKSFWLHWKDASAEKRWCIAMLGFPVCCFGMHFFDETRSIVWLIFTWVYLWSYKHNIIFSIFLFRIKVFGFGVVFVPACRLFWCFHSQAKCLSPHENLYECRCNSHTTAPSTRLLMMTSVPLLQKLVTN